MIARAFLELIFIEHRFYKIKHKYIATTLHKCIQYTLRTREQSCLKTSDVAVKAKKYVFHILIKAKGCQHRQTRCYGISVLG